MGYTYDYFVAPLKCRVCSNISKIDDSTNMVTAIRDQPELTYLGVGHLLKIPKSMSEIGYLTINSPTSEDEVRILQKWECPYCGQPYNWAEIVVRDGRIASIEAVNLNRKVFDGAHFISDECIDLVVALTNRPYADLRNADLVQILRELL